MISGMWWAIAVRYGARSVESRVRDAVIFTTVVSVLYLVMPRPGKCFMAGTTPDDPRPDANASARAAVRVALNENVRPWRYMIDDVDDGTSATGARFTLMPSPFRAVPVAAPWLRATDVLFLAPIWGAERVGGAHGIRLTEPPSWSTAMRNRG